MPIALTALLLALAPQDEVFSGPQKGEKTPGFTVFDLDKKKDRDFIAEWNGAPGVLFFIHEMTRPGFQLMRPVDRYAQMKSVRGLKIGYVALVDDRDAAERHLPGAKSAIFLTSPFGISVDGKEGPGAYGLNRDMTITILVIKGNKVHANFAILSPNETDYPKVKKAIDEVLAVEPTRPSGENEELAAEVSRLREENLRLREELIGARLDADRWETQFTRFQERMGKGRKMMRRKPKPPERPGKDD